MTLSDVLSKPLGYEFFQVDGFLNNKRLKNGNSKKLSVGRIALPFFCKSCDSDMTFVSSEDIYCIGVNKKQVSIDCVLTCPRCQSEIAVWFLVDCDNDISSIAPKVRVLKRTEKFTDNVFVAKERFGNYAELFGKAECAYRNELGAGSIVYLRKIYEQLTKQLAQIEGVQIVKSNGNTRPFKDVLIEVDKKRNIIPKEFSSDGYKLFCELSNIVHGNGISDSDALKKYEPLRRLVVSILENVRNSDELRNAMSSLGWQN